MIPLYFAAGGNHAVVVEQLISAGADLHAIDTVSSYLACYIAIVTVMLISIMLQDKWTALHMVVRNNCVATIQVLINLGISINAQSNVS